MALHGVVASHTTPLGVRKQKPSDDAAILDRIGSLATEYVQQRGFRRLDVSTDASVGLLQIG